MSLLVVVVVCVGAFFYIRTTRNARTAWLKKLGLVGRWHWDQGDCELILSGAPGGGTYVRIENEQKTQGAWKLQGHMIKLHTPDGLESYDLQYFQAGNIGLENAKGERRIYLKETSNVVKMQRNTH